MENNSGIEILRGDDQRWDDHSTSLFYIIILIRWIERPTGIKGEHYFTTLYIISLPGRDEQTVCKYLLY